MSQGEANLGPLVIGRERFEQLQREMQQTAHGNLGPLVTGIGLDPEPATAPVGEPVAPAGAPEAYSVHAIRDLLKESPAHVDHLLDLELARPDIRRTALRELLLGEQRQPGGPREAVVGRIEAALAALDAQVVNPAPLPPGLLEDGLPDVRVPGEE